MIKPKGEKGQILIISFIIMSALIVIVSAFIFMISARARGFAHQATDIKAFWLAEAGIEDKILELMNNNTSNIYDTEFGDGQYKVDCVADPATCADCCIADPATCADCYKLTSTGWISDPNQRKIEVTLEVLSQFSNPRGLCADDYISLSGQGEIDSYDSSLGSYGGSNIGSEAEIGSNIDISLSGQAEVKGNIELGETISLSGQAQVSGDVISGESIFGQSHITGDITENADPPPQPFDEAIIDLVYDEVEFYSDSSNNDNDNAYLISEGFLNDTEFTLKANEICYMPPGNYYFTEFDISGNAELNIIGEVRIYYDGSTKVSLAGQGVVNSSDNVSNFSLISRSGSDIKYSGQADFAGLIFAPNAEVEYGGQADYFGGAVAREISITGQGDFHSDINLDAGPGTQSITGIEQISWHDGS